MPDRPLKDEFDREVFYRGQDPDAEDEADYELEPPDEAVIAGEKRRAAEAMDRASRAVDINQLYRESESLGVEDVQAYLKDIRFQFGIKHLLAAMTLLAVVFVVGRYILGGFGTVLLVLTFLLLAGAYGWVTWQEQIRLKQWEQKRDELYRQNQQRYDDADD